jgi:hypothetical protein
MKQQAGIGKVATEFSNLSQPLTAQLGELELDHGGSTRISIGLIDQLYQYADYADGNYRYILNELKQLLELTQFIGDITQNKTCGADFTYITRSILSGVEGYVNAEERRSLDRHSVELHEYMYDRDKAWWSEAKKCAVGVAMVTVAAALSAVAVASVVTVVGTEPAALLGAGAGALGSKGVDLIKDSWSTLAPPIPVSEDCRDLDVLRKAIPHLGENAQWSASDT